MPIGVYKHKPSSKKCKENISKGLIGNKNFLGHIPWNKGLTKETDERVTRIGKKVSKKLIGKKKTKAFKEKMREVASIPEALERSLKNGYGTKCYSDDDLFFPSLSERDCYYWLRDDVKEGVKIEKFGRFDFILTLKDGRKVALEYHPCDWFLESKNYREYYDERRKLLDRLGYRNLKLIVMTSLKEEEKERVRRLLS